jgi:alpha-mannosidase
MTRVDHFLRGSLRTETFSERAQYVSHHCGSILRGINKFKQFSAFIIALFGLLSLLPLEAQRRQPETWLSGPDRLVLSQLSELSAIPAGGWRMHEGNIPHGENVDLDDSSWQPAGMTSGTPESAVWFRKWIEIPKVLNGYDLTGARVYLNFLVNVVRGDGAESQGFLAATKIIYFDGNRVALGEDLEPIVLVDQVAGSKKILVAVKVLTTPASQISVRPSLRVEFAPDRPNPQDLHDEIQSAAILIPSLSKDMTADKSTAESAIGAIDIHALKAGDQQKFDDSLKQAEKVLAPLRPMMQNATFVLTGQSHIDAAYRWPWTEAVDVVHRTFGTAVQLMDEYPKYTYTQSATQYYAWMAAKYPALNDEIKDRISQGRWEVVGGMWVEPDFNIPDGESQVRQLLVGKRWLQKEYGVDVRVGWNPDSFGFDWQLPQIYKKSGVDFFMTTKLAWSDTNKLPFHLFWWQSPDGSRVLTYFPPTFASSDLSPVRLSEGFVQLRGQAPGLNEIMDVYGVGDHGGGATRPVLDQGVRWMQPGKVAPDMKFGTALSFFTDVQGKISDRSPVWNYRIVATGETQLSAPAPDKISIPTWDDELYLEYHRGTYTTQAAQKANIRKIEERMLNAEKCASLAWLEGRTYPSDELNEAWKKILFNGFHDLAAGSGAGPVYKDAANDFEQLGWATNEITSAALGAIASEIDTRVVSGVPVLVFNPLAWPRDGVVEVTVQLPAAGSGIAVLDSQDRSLPFVILSKDESTHSYHLLVDAKQVPSLGYRVLHVIAHAQPFPSDLKVHGFTLENDVVRVTVDPKTGCITSLYDKKANFETLAAGSCGNQLLAYIDTPTAWDAWNINPNYERSPVDLGPAKSVRVLESGPMRAVIRVTHATQHSTFSQDITLHAGADYVDVINDFDWHESHVMLKAAFPLAASSAFATYEIPYGTIERPTTRNNSWEDAKFEVPAIRWADLGNGHQGLSLINESKYGYDARGNVLRLTLLRSPMAPDPTADRGANVFSYALYPHGGDWKQALTMRRGYEYNYKLSAMQVEPHAGALPQEHSFLHVDPDTVVLTALKKAEDSNGLILRFYDWAGKTASVKIDVPPGASSATETNLMEQPEGSALPVSAGRQITSTVHPYEIQTIKVSYPSDAGLHP